MTLNCVSVCVRCITKVAGGINAFHKVIHNDNSAVQLLA